MKNRRSAPFIALSIAAMLSGSIAHAQLKPPAKLQPKDGLGGGLGGGLGSRLDPVTPGPATPGTPTTPAQDKASADTVVQDIANCVLAGLPPDWTLAQIEVTELGRNDKQREFEATYTFKDGAGKAGAFTPCDPREPALNVYKLNGALEPAKRNWIRATLVLSKEGRFELQYDYRDKQGDASKPAATDAKKEAKKAAAKK